MTEPTTGHGLQTDEELIAAFQQGRADAFSQLVGRYKHQLTNFVYRFLGDFDEADDVVQETFIRVYRNRHSFKPIARFSTWVYTIASNLAKTQLRRRKYHQILSISRKQAVGGRRGESDIDLPATEPGADVHTDRMLLAERIQNALAAISPRYREVVVLFDVQEFSYEEIVKITGLPMGTVKSRLNRGRAQLQKLLEDFVNE
jgi:RNA polymerase sigma-70 factor (ECF subfamily)